MTSNDPASAGRGRIGGESVSTGGASRLLSRRDLEFLLYEWLDVERLLDRERFKQHSRETFDALLDTCRLIAERDFATHNKLADSDEPRWDGESVTVVPETKAALDRYLDAGLQSLTFDDALGGGQVPNVIAVACNAWFQAANIATYSYLLLTVANANLITEFGTPEQVESFARPQIEGRFFGTMCLSEPQAGSSLAAITTTAEPDADGTHRLRGSKMWISAGEHSLSENIVHLVLARTPGAAPGVKGLSLFVVPKWLLDPDGRPGERNDVALVGVNHKMGYRGTVNTVLSFGDGTYRPGGRAGAVGYLIGPPGAGLACMFRMMNEARVAVGAGAAALGYTAYLKALAYARTRVQGAGLGKPAAGQVALVDHPDVKRMLLAQKAYVEGGLALSLYCACLLDEQLTAAEEADVATASALLDILTPIVKSWPSQWCLAANDLAIQVHGGYGYSREYDVEQHYRDNRLNPIHEGTHGIQALDLLGRKVRMDDGRCLLALTDAIGRTVNRAMVAGSEAGTLGEALGDAVARLRAVTRSLWAGGDPATALPNATVYLEAAGHIVLAWIWLEQFLAAEGKDGAFYAGKRQAARYFFAVELPKTAPQLDLLDRNDMTVQDTAAEWL